MSKFDGFARGVLLGQQLVQMYEGAQEKRELSELAKSKPTESKGYTAEDGQQLEAIAGAKDAEGKPYYTVSASEDGTYQVTPNFQLDGAAAPAASIGQRTMTDFLGKRSEGTLSDGRVQNMRTRAQADIIGRRDPAAGQRLMRDLVKDERDEARFVTEQASAKTQARMTDIQLRAAEEAEKAKAAQRDFTVGFANGGWAGVPALYERYNDGNTVKVEEDGKGGATLTQINADGKVIGTQAYRDRLEFYQDAMARFDPSKWADAQEKRVSTERTQANEDRKFGLEETKAKTDADYKRGMLDIYGRREDAKPEAAEKIPPMVKLRAEGLQRAATAAETAYNKGLADGSDPSSPGMQQLLKSMRVSQKSLETLVAPYLPGGPSAPPDILNLRKPTDAPAGGKPGYAKESDLRQTASGDMGADPQAVTREIRKTEADLEKVKDAPSRRLLQDHIASLKAAAEKYGLVTAPPATPVRRPEVTMSALTDSKKAAAPAAEKPATPADAAGAQLDNARSAMALARSAAQKYGLKQRRDDPEGFARAQQLVEQASAELARAESAYERLVTPVAQSAAMGRYARP